MWLVTWNFSITSYFVLNVRSLPRFACYEVKLRAWSRVEEIIFQAWITEKCVHDKTKHVGKYLYARKVLNLVFPFANNPKELSKCTPSNLQACVNCNQESFPLKLSVFLPSPSSAARRSFFYDTACLPLVFRSAVSGRVSPRPEETPGTDWKKYPARLWDVSRSLVPLRSQNGIHVSFHPQRQTETNRAGIRGRRWTVRTIVAEVAGGTVGIWVTRLR